MRERTTFFLTVAALVLIAVGVAAAVGLDLMPEQATERARVVDQLFRTMIGVATVIFLLVEGALLYAVLRFRARDDEEGDAEAVHGNTSLEVVWTLIPAIIVVVIGVYSFRVLAQVEAPSDDEMVVEVIGRQFSWEFRYPQQDNLTSNELHLIVNQPVRFEITSEDVIHSFYIPAFRAKRDATPGQISDLVVTPTRQGRFPVRCAELCGPGHAQMLSEAIVGSEQDFQMWVEAVSSLPSDPTEAGRFLFEKYGCNACHTLTDAGSDSTVGPVLDGIGERAATQMEELDAEAYLRQSILEPNAHIVEGFPENMMPQDFGDRMTEDELLAMINYLMDQ